MGIFAGTSGGRMAGRIRLGFVCTQLCYLWKGKSMCVSIRGKKMEKRKDEMPESARRKLQGRKSLFLSTHVNELIKNPEDSIRNIDYILQLFQENKDIALWWRPHPLSRVMINTFSAKYGELYDACIRKARELDNCFYDDTQDMANALVYTDAYLGDESSLVPVYAATGKMVRILSQQEYMRDNINEIDILLSVQCFCIVEDEIWFVLRNFNALYRMNCKNRELEFVLEFEGEPREKENLCRWMIFYKNQIFFIPSTAEKVYILNLENMQMESLELPMEYRKKRYKAGACCVDKDSIWVLPFESTDGYRIDMPEKKVICMEHMVPEKSVYDFGTKMDHMILATDPRSDQMLCYNVYSETTKFVRFNQNSFTEKMVVAYHQYFYLFSGKEAYIYDQEMRLLDKRLLISDTREIIAMDYLINDTDIWLVYYPDFILCWNIEDDKVKKYELEYRRPIRRAATLGIMGCGVLHQDEEKVYCLPGDYGYFIEIDKKTGEKKEYPLTVDLNWVHEYLAEDIKRKELKDFYYNDRLCSINQYLQLMRNSHVFCKNERQIKEAEKLLGRTDGKVGESIVDYIVKELY